METLKQWCSGSVTIAVGYLIAIFGFIVELAPLIVDVVTSQPELAAEFKSWLPSGWYTMLLAFIFLLARYRTLIR